MWATSVSSKHIDKLTKQDAYVKHIQKLYHTKPTVNNKSPAQFDFMKTNMKKQIKKLQQQKQIDKKNDLLAAKLQNPTSTVSKISNNHTKGSLNSNINKRRQNEIQKENQRLLQKFKNVNSQYSKKKLDTHAEKYDKIKSNIAYSKMQQTYDLLQDTHDLLNSIKGQRKKRPETAKSRSGTSKIRPGTAK